MIKILSVWGSEDLVAYRHVRSMVWFDIVWCLGMECGLRAENVVDKEKQCL
jgi:hypothetical protein